MAPPRVSISKARGLIEPRPNGRAFRAIILPDRRKRSDCLSPSTSLPRRGTQNGNSHFRCPQSRRPPDNSPLDATSWCALPRRRPLVEVSSAAGDAVRSHDRVQGRCSPHSPLRSENAAAMWWRGGPMAHARAQRHALRTAQGRTRLPFVSPRGSWDMRAGEKHPAASLRASSTSREQPGRPASRFPCSGAAPPSVERRPQRSRYVDLASTQGSTGRHRQTPRTCSSLPRQIRIRPCVWHDGPP